MNSWIPWLVVAIAVAVGSFTDIRRFKVYNSLTIPIFLLGLLFHTMAPEGSGILFSLGGAMLGLGILLIPYLMGGLGAGDVKFMMAIGAWLGASVVVFSIVVGCVAIVIYHLAVVVRRSGALGMKQALQLMVMRLTSFGHSFALNDQFESVQSASNSLDSPNRGRLIPFSAMMSVGIVVAIAISLWRGR